ncbi:cysteine desulfurase family protein [Candidatus Endowatersipora endosymbiont of Watersipora subatra]|uniref:cysteine desulfurase family protein n=1 Tax=Candidatus Endowatersipora endosymbiont of Watersipora subatra TaxID=3077946 RepID=UPI00312CB14A
MANSRVYLDHNASSSLREGARQAMIETLSLCGNPSSVHKDGRFLRFLLEKARAQIGAFVGVDADNVIFTSSATEAANLALTPDVYKDGDPCPAGHLYVLESEHPCVLAGGRFLPQNISTIPVNENGIIDHEALETLLKCHDHNRGLAYVAVQLVNSETGVIQPVSKIVRSVRLHGGYVLCDAVQAAGKMPVCIQELGVDFLLLSGHKIGGPHGVGALVSANAMLHLPSAIKGGGQERTRRAGTENVVAIVGFGNAAQEASEQLNNFVKLSTLRDSIENHLTSICQSNGLIDRLVFFGQEVSRVGNTLAFSVRGLNAETSVIAFDLDGVSISSGSACSSGKVGRSHVLAAMGIDEESSKGAMRVSLGWNSTQSDAEKFLNSFKRITKRLRKRSGDY